MVTYSNQDKPQSCLQLVGVCALSHSKVEKFGKPTWRKLAKAVEDQTGGNNPALAHEIARKHSGVLLY